MHRSEETRGLFAMMFRYIFWAWSNYIIICVSIRALIIITIVILSLKL